MFLFILYRDDTFVRGGTCWDMYHFLALADRHVSTLMLKLHMLLHRIITYYHRISVHIKYSVHVCITTE